MAEPERVGDILKGMLEDGFLQGPERHADYMARQEQAEQARYRTVHGTEMPDRPVEDIRGEQLYLFDIQSTERGQQTRR